MNTTMGWEAHIPVLGSADVVIIGGSLAGIACAVELAKGNRRVMIIEPRTYLGREITAPLRPWLELALGRALARCGSKLGYDILIAYVSDGRSLLAKGALQKLRAISGLSLGKEPQRWLAWLHEDEPYRHTFPLQTQLDMEPNSETILRAEGTLSIR